MFRRISVENLKIFGEQQEIELAPLTLIYGPNSGGKSTLIQALLLLKQTFESEGSWDPYGSPVMRGPIADIGYFPQVIHRQEASRIMRVGVTCIPTVTTTPHTSGDPFYPPWVNEDFASEDEDVSAEYAFAWNASSKTVTTQAITLASPKQGIKFTFKTAKDTYLWELADPKSAGLWHDWMEARVQHEKSGDTLALPSFWALTPRFAKKRLMVGEIVWHDTLAYPEPEVEPLTGSFDESRVERIWAQISSDWNVLLRRSLLELSYLGPLRRAPERFVLASGITPSSVGANGQHYVELLPGAVDRVNKWLKELRLPYSIAVARSENPEMADLRLVRLTDQRNNAIVSPRDVGFGVSQVLPIIVECLAGTSDTICIEQPELHLHPRLQAQLADLFIEVTSMSGRGRRQLIVETHSESLLLRLQRRIREGKLDPNNVAVLYVDPHEGGGATVQRLRIDRAGMFIDEWPDGFFEERLREMLIGYEN